MRVRRDVSTAFEAATTAGKGELKAAIERLRGEVHTEIMVLRNEIDRLKAARG